MRNVSAYIWSFTGRFGSQLLYLITSMVLARILTPEDFGMIGVLSVVFSVATTLIDSGLAGALMLEKELTKKNLGTIFVFNLVVSVVLYLCLFFSAPLIEDFYQTDGLAPLSRILGLVFIINAIGIVPHSTLTYHLRFKELSLTTLAGVVIASSVSILLASLGIGVYALVAYQLISALVKTIVCNLICHYHITICFDLESFKRMWRFGIFTTITSIIDSIYQNLISAIFGKYVSIAEAGYVSQAKKLEETSSSTLITTINSTTFPILSKLKDDKERFVFESKNLIQKVPLIIAPILLLLCVYSHEVISIVYGKEWIAAAPYLSYLTIAGFFMMVESINRSFIKSLGKVEQLFNYTIAKRFVGVTIMLVCAMLWSVEMILVGFIISSFIGYIVNSFLYSKITGQNLRTVIANSLYCFIYLFPLAVVLYITYFQARNVYVSIVINGLVIITYYLFAIRLAGINIFIYIRNGFHKKF